MYIARTCGENSKIIVAYSSVREAKQVMSCLTCKRYREYLPCKHYAVCRAEKEPDERPSMYLVASNVIIETRLTPAQKFCKVYQL